MVIYNMYNNMSLVTDKINQYNKYISNGGYENDTTNFLIDKLDTDNEVQKQDVSLIGIQKSQEINRMYDNVFKNLMQLTENYKTKLLDLNSDQNTNFDKANIQIELNSIKKSFDSVTSQKYENEDIFLTGKSEIYIDNTTMATRRMDKQFIDDINLIFSNIDIEMDGNVKIDQIDQIQNILLNKQTEMGAEGKNLLNLEKFKLNLKVSTIENFELRNNKLQENIINLNNATTLYNAIGQMFSNTKDLSLVNYI